MKYKLSKILNNRKTLYFVLSIVLVSVFTLTIAYAALNTVLKITGNAEVVASNWDIYLDNVQLVSGSATSTKPTITNKTTASFTTTLTNPGDYYMFTIDVVNNGTIDAMIDSIEKTPTLTESQSKYLNYIVEYQNGESINTKQLVEKNSFVRLKVKVEFRKDITASDLPKTSETLNLSFTVKYTQASENGTSNISNDGKLVKVVSGDYDTVGSEICIGEECFYVISSTDDTVTMLAKYNLYVGGYYNSSGWRSYENNATNKQDSLMLGYILGESIRNGITMYSDDNNKGINYSDYNGSLVENYVKKYKKYLESSGINILDSRLIKKEELEKIGCNGDEYSCIAAPKFIYNSSYWSQTSYNNVNVWTVNSKGVFHNNYCDDNYNFGVRPVITIPKY